MTFREYLTPGEQAQAATAAVEGFILQIKEAENKFREALSRLGYSEASIQTLVFEALEEYIIKP